MLNLTHTTEGTQDARLTVEVTTVTCKLNYTELNQTHHFPVGNLDDAI